MQFMSLIATPIPILSDNYAWLLRDTASGAIGIVDPAEAAPIVAAIEAAGGRLDLILLTHHHADHVAATDAIRDRYGCPVAGAAADAHRLPRLDHALRDGEHIALGSAHAEVIETPGHTRGHIAYHFAADGILLCGDTLFSLGCGRLLEGSAKEMFASLRRLAALPGETLICCGHEYSASNARFALHVDPHNAALQARAAAITALRAAGKPTLPARLDEELAANPFLRASNEAHFAELRAQKDRF